MTSRSNLKDEDIIGLVRKFIHMFRKFVNLGRSGTDNLNEVSGNMLRDVQGSIGAIIAVSDMHYRGEDIGLSSSHYWTESDFIRSLEESCEIHVQLAIHDKHYFDALIQGVVGPIKQGQMMPSSLRVFIADVISRKIKRPTKVCPTRNGYNYLRSTLWALILYVLDKELSIKPTVNDATRDNNQERSLLCGCDYIVEAWDEADIKYATVRDNNDLKKLRQNLDNFPYSFVFLNYWSKMARSI